MKAIALLVLVSFASAADFPQAEIKSSTVRAKIYLPDAQNGYYRGTRFDWSGVISSLEANGHQYFGQWFERYDPKLHDAIQGPVEEFQTKDAVLGYADAKPGESFVRIGVGALKKPAEARFERFKTYEIVDNGKWSVSKGADWIRFTQALGDTAGYAYRYEKTLRLARRKPELIIEHRLRNTGRKVIETNVYNHNFYMLDGRPTGPDFVVRFPFELRSVREMNGLAEVRGKELLYLKELEKGQTAQTELQGFGPTAGDYDIRVENRKSGAGVRQIGDRPISKIVFWSIRTTVCPEAYVEMRIDPGKESQWRIVYEFYKVP